MTPNTVSCSEDRRVCETSGFRKDSPALWFMYIILLVALGSNDEARGNQYLVAFPRH